MNLYSIHLESMNSLVYGWLKVSAGNETRKTQDLTLTKNLLCARLCFNSFTWSQ